MFMNSVMDFFSQITNTLEELIYNEEMYIRSLNYGINGYMRNFNRKAMPKVLRGQMYRVFGNIHRIKDFHENVFFPALRLCNMDIVKICNTFCDFIEVRRNVATKCSVMYTVMFESAPNECLYQ